MREGPTPRNRTTGTTTVIGVRRATMTEHAKRWKGVDDGRRRDEGITSREAGERVITKPSRNTLDESRRGV